MEEKKTMSQQEFLRDAMKRLGMTRQEFAARLNLTSRYRLDNWLLPSGSTGFRELDPVIWQFVREILDSQKKA